MSITEKMLCEGLEAFWKSYGANLSQIAAPLEDAFNAMLSAAPTPAEVEPVGTINRVEMLGWLFMSVDLNSAGESLPDGTLVYTSPPSLKAEWDAEGNPMNLEAAARDVCNWVLPKDEEGWRIVNNLRKFLKDES